MDEKNKEANTEKSYSNLFQAFYLCWEKQFESLNDKSAMIS